MCTCTKFKLVGIPTITIYMIRFKTHHQHQHDPGDTGIGPHFSVNLCVAPHDERSPSEAAKQGASPVDNALCHIPVKKRGLPNSKIARGA